MIPAGSAQTRGANGGITDQPDTTTNIPHKSATMTLDLYGHLFPDQLDEVADALDAAHVAAAVPQMCPTSNVVDLGAVRGNPPTPGNRGV